MREDQVHPADNVIAFRRARPAGQEVSGSRGVPDGAEESTAPSGMVLKADRGIINTGTVHGGQHVTVTELFRHPASGADGDV
ncbi:S-type pyocin domain-containing protein [Streptomyces sp. NPDC096136]|uniref:S-type pyocin domain-containing protein n=1 Tax=Streptomyces sp. NPDC096136 TaxID=3366076 RepID=UPI0038136666